MRFGKTVVAGAFATMALSGAASAATLDFTASNDTSGTIVGTTWTVSTRAADTLTNATHGNNNGCMGSGWNFACSAVGGSFDVGFGVSGDGTNNNEIDGKLGRGSRNEFVQVSFGDVVKITGFAGMLAYEDVTPPTLGLERVRLQYRVGTNAWQSVSANPLFTVNEGSGNFDTVGLAFKDGLSLFADTVRFRAAGTGDADDGTFNVTAAGLQVSAVPLPAAGWLMLAGFGGLAAMKRRKKA